MAVPAGRALVLASSLAAACGLPPREPQPCVLPASVSYPADAASLLGYVIFVRNRGAATWYDVVVTLRGDDGASPTGPYRQRLAYIVRSTALEFDRFRNSDDASWMRETMRPRGIAITATVEGRACVYEEEFDE